LSKLEQQLDSLDRIKLLGSRIEEKLKNKLLLPFAVSDEKVESCRTFLSGDKKEKAI